MLNRRNTDSKTKGSSILNFSDVGKNLSAEFDRSNIRAQAGLWNSIKAKAHQAFSINTVRNSIGDLFHGDDFSNLTHRKHEKSEAVNLFSKLYSHLESATKIPLKDEKASSIFHPTSLEKMLLVNEDVERIAFCMEGIKALGNHHKFFKITLYLKKYCHFIEKSKNCSKEIINAESSNFLEDILKLIPENKKEEAQTYFGEMLYCSTHFLNDLDTPPMEQKAFSNSYKEAIENLVNLLIDNDEHYFSNKSEDKSLPLEQKKIFKDIILISIFYAGQLITYQKRNLGDKLRIRLKQAFIPCAYLFGAVSGTLIGHYITTSLITNIFLSLSISVGSVFPPILISIIGLAAGYLLTKFIEKIIDYNFNNAKKNINNICLQSIEKRKNSIELEYLLDNKKESNYVKKDKINSSINRNKAKESLLFGKNNIINLETTEYFASGTILEDKKTFEIEYKINSIQEKMVEYKKSVDSFFNRTQTYFSENYFNNNEQFNKIDTLKFEILDLFHLLTNNDDELLSDFIFTMHEFINCSDDKSEKVIELETRRIQNIMKKIIPSSLAQEKLNIILECTLILALKTRPNSTASMRRSFALIYVLSDVLTDILGTQAAVYTNGLVEGLSEGLSLSAEFAANLIIGFIPLGIGIIFYLSITTWSIMKDKKEVNIPNEHSIWYVRNHLINQKKHIRLGNALISELNICKNYLPQSTFAVNNGEYFTGTTEDISKFLSQEKIKLHNRGKFLVFKTTDFDYSNNTYKIN